MQIRSLTSIYNLVVMILPLILSHTHTHTRTVTTTLHRVWLLEIWFSYYRANCNSGAHARTDSFYQINIKVDRRINVECLNRKCFYAFVNQRRNQKKNGIQIWMKKISYWIIVQSGSYIQPDPVFLGSRKKNYHAADSKKLNYNNNISSSGLVGKQPASTLT